MCAVVLLQDVLGKRYYACYICGDLVRIPIVRVEAAERLGYYCTHCGTRTFSPHVFRV